MFATAMHNWQSLESAASGRQSLLPTRSLRNRSCHSPRQSTPAPLLNLNLLPLKSLQQVFLLLPHPPGPRHHQSLHLSLLPRRRLLLRCRLQELQVNSQLPRHRLQHRPSRWLLALVPGRLLVHVLLLSGHLLAAGPEPRDLVAPHHRRLLPPLLGLRTLVDQCLRRLVLHRAAHRAPRSVPRRPAHRSRLLIPRDPRLRLPSMLLQPAASLRAALLRRVPLQQRRLPLFRSPRCQTPTIVSPSQLPAASIGSRRPRLLQPGRLLLRGSPPPPPPPRRPQGLVLPPQLQHPRLRQDLPRWPEQHRP